MPRHSNVDRDIAIYKMKEEDARSFRYISNFFNMAVSSVHKAYERGAKRLAGTRVRLPPQLGVDN